MFTRPCGDHVPQFKYSAQSAAGGTVRTASPSSSFRTSGLVIAALAYVVSTVEPQ